MNKDPYDALGLKKTATDAEIKKAYRKIARDSHPDLNPDDKAAEAKFKAASAAYDLLKDPELRGKFDRGEIDATGAERPERRYYREYAEAPNNPYGGSRFDDSMDASDIFAEFMRQRAHAERGQSYQDFDARGADRHYTMEVPFLDAVNGGTTRITLPEGGTLDVKIPKGTDDGRTIRLRGKGAPGYGKGKPGDALVTIYVRPHPTFRREGDDIFITLPISLDEAVLGGKVQVPTIDGSVQLTIPKGASSGQKLRMRGRGVKGWTSTKRGDQIVELKIVSPPVVDDELAEFMEKWRKKHKYNPRKGMKT
jgi:DnaJ-class molecular chaperone